jgi:hypothetical protein
VNRPAVSLIFSVVSIFYPENQKFFWAMNFRDRSAELIADACHNKNKIILILKNGNGWYEGVVEKIYEQKIVKFATKVPGRVSSVSGFLLISDILEVIY